MGLSWEKKKERGKKESVAGLLEKSSHAELVGMTERRALPVDLELF